MARMKDKAIVGNIGHFDNEIDMAGLKKITGIKRINIKPQYDEWTLPGRPQRADPRRGPAAESRLRDRPSELRDVGVVHQPGDRAARAAPAQRQVREEGLHPAEAPRRGSRAAAPGAPRREAHEADARNRPTTSACRSRGRTSRSIIGIEHGNLPAKAGSYMDDRVASGFSRKLLISRKLRLNVSRSLSSSTAGCLPSRRGCGAARSIARGSS